MSAPNPRPGKFLTSLLQAQNIANSLFLDFEGRSTLGRDFGFDLAKRRAREQIELRRLYRFPNQSGYRGSANLRALRGTDPTLDILFDLSDMRSPQQWDAARTKITAYLATLTPPAPFRSPRAE